MSKIEALEVVDLTHSAEDLQQLERISLLSRRVMAQEIPGYQVDVGDGMVGMLAVRTVIETEVNGRHGNLLASESLPRWAMTHDANFAGYGHQKYQQVTNTFAPHKDRTLHGMSIHRNYMSPGPIPVQLGFTDIVPPNSDPSFTSTEHYKGALTVADYAETVYEGESVSGRLTIFSQGKQEDDLFGMQPAMHFFDRRDLPFAGHYARYSCSDLTSIDWTDVPYDDFVAMRGHASNHLEYARWQAIIKALPDQRDKLAPSEYDEIYQRVETQVDESRQYADFRFWSLRHGVDNELGGRLSYGVFSRKYPETSVIDPYILQLKNSVSNVD